jgi:hypothetical protein
MAETSKSVAVASWIESTAAKYVAVVGLVFVPAASIAVCRIFIPVTSMEAEVTDEIL